MTYFSLSIIDMVIVGLFLLFMLILGIRASRGVTLNGFFVHNRNVKKFLLILTSFSTFIGGGTIIGIINFGYSKGLLPVIMGIAFAIGFWLVGAIAPVIKEKTKNLYTLPQFLESIYDKKTSFIASLVNLVAYFFLTAVQFVALGTFFKLILGWEMLASIMLAGLILVIYTSLGGLISEFYTDYFQAFFMLLAIPFILFFLIKQIGNISLIPQDLVGQFLITKDLLFIIVAFLFWAPSLMVSMDVWQRIFAAKDKKTAMHSMQISGFIILAIFVIFTLIGILARILFPNINPELVAPTLVVKLLPKGLLGLGLIAILAALMSTADSMLIVTGVTLTKDIYKRWINKKASDKNQLKFARASTFVVGLVAILIGLKFQNIIALIGNALSSLTILLPAVIGGLFWRKANHHAAFYSIFIGFILLILSLFTIFKNTPQGAVIPSTIIATIIFILGSLKSKR